MAEQEKTIEIDLKRLLFALFNKAWLLLIVAVLAGVLAFGYSHFFMAPMYSASTKLYVNNTYGAGSEGFSHSQLTAARDLANTYMVIVESRPVLDKVRQITGLEYTDGELAGMISCATVNDTEIFQVRVVGEDHIHSRDIANAIADVLPNHIGEVISGTSVTVVERASNVRVKVSPNKTQNTIFGFAIGFILTAAVIVIVELTNDILHSEEYLTRTYPDVPLLAVIPDNETSTGYGRYYKGYSTERTKTPVPPTLTGGDGK